MVRWGKQYLVGMWGLVDVILFGFRVTQTDRGGGREIANTGRELQN